MTHQDKIAKAKELIYAQRTQLCVLLCSFGKDSMVLLHLIREVMPLNRLNCCGYPIPLIYYRQPWFAFKDEFANKVIRKWALEVYDLPPAVCGVKAKEDQLELVARYPFGKEGIDLPLNTCAPIPRRPYLCGRVWLMRPTVPRAAWPWPVVFHGHKSSDVDPYDGPMPLRADQVDAAGLHLVFPLREWTDSDVWQYTEENHVPFDKRRYRYREELADKWENPDYIHACTACIDPRVKAAEVFCPKLQTKVPMVGHLVTRLEQIPEYIEQRGD